MKRSDLIANFIFWCLIILVNMVLFYVNSYFNQSNYTVYYFVAVSFVNVLTYYSNYLVYIPKLLLQKKEHYTLYYIIVILATIAFSAVVKTIVFSLFKVLVLIKNDHAFYSDWFYLNTLFTSGFYIASSLLIKFTSDWFSNETKKSALELEKKEMEIAFLHSQLSPHFLFNALNNIYSLSIQNSKETPDVILKLSDIMRYMLYESNEMLVLLKSEIDYLMSFIELQKLRYQGKTQVHFNIYGEVSNQKIIPLLLISFVENAFKHGLVNDPKHPIEIEIIANEKILHFSVKNKKNSHKKERFGGLGLKNVERRLELMYPDRYKFNVINTQSNYTTELIIEL